MTGKATGIPPLLSRISSFISSVDSILAFCNPLAEGTLFKALRDASALLTEATAQITELEAINAEQAAMLSAEVSPTTNKYDRVTAKCGCGCCDCVCKKG